MNRTEQNRTEQNRTEQNRTSRVLVADIPAGVQLIQELLGPAAKITEVNTLSEAKLLLNDSFDLVICGLHFDDSRMFDFLRFCKADPLFRGIPFLCFMGFNSELCATVLEGLRIACRALGANDFVDLYDLKQRNGVQEANSQFRKIIISLIEKSG